MSIKLRAEILAKIREFFVARKVLEVETPLLSHSTNPAAHLNSFCLDNNLYLQTSPEFAMKRLLASGSGDIYQICKAFRKGELGRLHNPEFTILEWYRINFTHHDLMQEVASLLKLIFNNFLNISKIEFFTYREVFLNILQIDPFDLPELQKNNLEKLKSLAKSHNILLHTELADNYDDWLQLLFTHLIEPKIGLESPVFIYDFPESQAMLARVRPEGEYNFASRFEVYFKGVELANGFHELKDAAEQRKRFLFDLELRKQLNLPAIPIDENFLAALPNLPDCSGVAIGIDRLLLLCTQANNLENILCYTFDIA